MSGSLAARIDSGRCIGCGLCVAVCPDRTLCLTGDKAAVCGTECISCGHCQAVCPTGAVSVSPAAMDFATFREELHWLPFGDFDLVSLVRLMRSRRSCRNFTEQPVSLDLLEDLVRIGTTAPSGTNSQGWTFTIVEPREEVIRFGNQVAAFFSRLNNLAANPLLRLASRLFAGDRLGRYYRSYYPTIARGLAEWREQGRDRLFHGAPAVMLVGGRDDASCPAEDAMLASQNILLAAHAMGLGTCLIGFAVEAIRHEPALKARLVIPVGESIYAVIALGYPAEKYQQVCGRKAVTPRYPRLAD
ncbi:MAG: nitroreductase [Desulfurivibrio sp.]|nr:MAG: nitroreductase [Desulfurivibrio sp.]